MARKHPIFVKMFARVHRARNSFSYLLLSPKGEKDKSNFESPPKSKKIILKILNHLSCLEREKKKNKVMGTIRD